jgi:hypothetical protein
MRILAFIAAIVLASNDSSATEPDLAKLAGARSGEYVYASHPISGYGRGVWMVELGSAPSVRNGWCTSQQRSVYASDHAIGELKFPFKAYADSLVAFTELGVDDCKGEPKGPVLFVDETSLPYLADARALLDRAALDRYAAVSHCSRYFPDGSAGLSFSMRAVSLDRGMLMATLFHEGTQMRVWFPIADGRLDPAGAKSSCTRMSDIMD